MTDRTPTLADEIAEVKRELAMRRHAFMRFVAGGKLSQEDAEWRIACLTATLQRLLALAGPPPQGALPL